MWSRIKGYLFLAGAGAAVYFLLSFHIIFYGQDASLVQNIYLLKKSKLNLHYTFFSLHQKKPDGIMKIKPLREDGIGDVLVELGLLTEEDKSRLESQYR